MFNVYLSSILALSFFDYLLNWVNIKETSATAIQAFSSFLFDIQIPWIELGLHVFLSTLDALSLLLHDYRMI